MPGNPSCERADRGRRHGHDPGARPVGEETITSVSDLEELLSVEEIHSSHFESWEKQATDPLARMAFRLAADKEINHVRWV